MSLKRLCHSMCREKRNIEIAKAERKHAVEMGVAAAVGVAAGLLLALRSGLRKCA